MPFVYDRGQYTPGMGMAQDVAGFARQLRQEGYQRQDVDAARRREDQKIIFDQIDKQMERQAEQEAVDRQHAELLQQQANEDREFTLRDRQLQQMDQYRQAQIQLQQADDNRLLDELNRRKEADQANIERWQRAYELDKSKETYKQLQNAMESSAARRKEEEDFVRTRAKTQATAQYLQDGDLGQLTNVLDVGELLDVAKFDAAQKAAAAKVEADASEPFSFTIDQIQHTIPKRLMGDGQRISDVIQQDPELIAEVRDEADEIVQTLMEAWLAKWNEKYADPPEEDIVENTLRAKRTQVLGKMKWRL